MAFALHASRPDVHVLILVALAVCTCHGALGSTSPPLLPPPGPYQYVRSTRQFYGPKGAFSTDVYDLAPIWHPCLYQQQDIDQLLCL